MYCEVSFNVTLVFCRMYVNVSGCGFSLHSDIVMPYIEHFGTPEQQEKFIPAMVAGTKIGAIAMTEPSAGRCVLLEISECQYGVP